MFCGDVFITQQNDKKLIKKMEHRGVRESTVKTTFVTIKQNSIKH